MSVRRQIIMRLLLPLPSAILKYFFAGIFQQLLQLTRRDPGQNWPNKRLIKWRDEVVERNG